MRAAVSSFPDSSLSRIDQPTPQGQDRWPASRNALRVFAFAGPIRSWTQSTSLTGPAKAKSMMLVGLPASGLPLAQSTLFPLSPPKAKLRNCWAKRGGIWVWQHVQERENELPDPGSFFLESVAGDA